MTRIETGSWVPLIFPEYLRQLFPISSRASRDRVKRFPGSASRSTMQMISNLRPSASVRTKSAAEASAPASGTVPGLKPFFATYCFAR
jgi:hypothetical protein